VGTKYNRDWQAFNRGERTCCGEWLNWLEKKMFELLSLPESETEKFIASKAAEGKPVEDMTVKNLREEVAKWKADFDKQKSEVENLFAEKSALEDDKKRLNEERDETQSRDFFLSKGKKSCNFGVGSRITYNLHKFSLKIL